MANRAIFFNLNSVLMGIVGVNVQGTTQPLLATHAVNIWSFLLAKLVHCFALIVADDIINPGRGGRQNEANYIHFWSFIAFISGFLSSVSLVTIFVATSTSDIILCIAWICAAMIVVVYQYGRLFLDACRWLYHELLKPFFKNIWNRFRGNNMSTGDQQPRPSV